MEKKEETKASIETIDERVLQEYEILRKVGSGGYGIVWKVLEKKSRKTLALKKMINVFQNEADAKHTYREIKYLEQLKGHDNIVKLVDVFKDQNNKDIYIVTDYMDSDLHAVIRAQVMEEKHRQYIIYQILRGLKYIHSANLVHRDLKPSNILINPKCEVKISDFGMVRSLRESRRGGSLVLTEQAGTRWYRAPEVFFQAKVYGKPVDMWAVGCLLAEMITGKPLFPAPSIIDHMYLLFALTGVPSEEEKKELQCDKAFLSEDPQKPLPKVDIATLCPSASSDALDFMRRLLVFKQQERMTVEQALNHPYVAEFHSSSEEPIKKVEPRLELEDNITYSVEDYRQGIYQTIANRRKRQKDKPVDILTKLKQLRFWY